MANQYGVNVAEALTAGEGILNSRAKRQAAQAEANRAKDLAEIRGQYAQNPGNENLKNQLLIMDSDGMKKMADAVKTMDEAERERAKQISLGLARKAKYIMDSQDPSSAWTEIYQSAPPNVQNEMGPEYNPSKVKAMFIDGMTASQLFDNPEAIEFGDKQVMFKNGQQVGSTRSARMRGKDADAAQGALNRQGDKTPGGGRQLKSGDSNAIAQRIATIFDGRFDPVTGAFQIEEPALRKKALDVMAKASKIYRENPELSHNEAANRAYREYENKSGTFMGM